MNRRVVHITTVHRPRDPRIYYKEVATLASAGYDVHLIAQGEPGLENRAIADVGAKVHQLESSGRSLLHRAARIREAAGLARALSADVYHIHDPELIPLLRRLKRATGAFTIYDMHEDYAGRGRLSDRFIRGAELRSFRWLDHVVLADEAYEPIVADRNVGWTVVQNYPLRPLVQPLSRARLPRDPFRLVYTGVVARSRGLFELIKLGAAIRDAGLNWTIDIVGVCHDGSAAAARAEIARLSLESVVRPTGWESYVDMRIMEEHLQQAHVGLIPLHSLPNYRSVMPTKLFEYLQFGLPVVAPSFPRIRSFVEANRIGAGVDPVDTGALLAVLIDWYRDREKYEALSAASLATSASYRWELAGARLLSAYQGLAVSE